MNKKIVELINLLNNKISEFPDNCYFNEEANVNEIIDFDVELGITLPDSYKIFLNNFNGGFICNDSLAKSIKKNDSLEDARWNSIHLFGLDEIRNAYNDKSQMNWKVFGDEYNVYPFIPFCRTSIGELLIFVNPLNKNDECPVFDACHEEFPDSWGSLFKDFTEMLESYVATNGNIETTSYDSPTAAEFISNQKKE